MSTPAHTDQSQGNPQPTRTLGVAAIGYAFMGKAHSNAWRNVASYFDVPAFEQKVLVGRDAGQVAAAAVNYGWAESATDSGRCSRRPSAGGKSGRARCSSSTRSTASTVPSRT